MIESCLDQAITSQSFRDVATPISEPIDAQVFVSIAGVLHECAKVVFAFESFFYLLSCRFLGRFKNAIAIYPRLSQLVKSLCKSFQDWHSTISANSEAFGNSFKSLQPPVREIFVSSIKEKVDRLASILEREEGKYVDKKEKKDRNSSSATTNAQAALAAALHTTYKGPGHLREEGPRHDNDSEFISEIRIAPTNDELMCRVPPFLLANFFAAPHPAPPDSMQRLLDIQFRLLREELMYECFHYSSYRSGSHLFFLKRSVAKGCSTSS